MPARNTPARDRLARLLRRERQYSRTAERLLLVDGLPVAHPKIKALGVLHLACIGAIAAARKGAPL